MTTGEVPAFISANCGSYELMRAKKSFFERKLGEARVGGFQEVTSDNTRGKDLRRRKYVADRSQISFDCSDRSIVRLPMSNVFKITQTNRAKTKHSWGKDGGYIM